MESKRHDKRLVSSHDSLIYLSGRLVTIELGDIMYVSPVEEVHSPRESYGVYVCGRPINVISSRDRAVAPVEDCVEPRTPTTFSKTPRLH